MTAKSFDEWWDDLPEGCCQPSLREAWNASRAALLADHDVAGLVPVAFVVQADRDGSFDNRIAPAAWSTFDLEMGKLRQHAWVKAGAAKIVPLYSADALESLAAQNAALKANRDYWLGSCQQAQEHRDGANAQLAERDAEIANLKAHAEAAVPIVEHFCSRNPCWTNGIATHDPLGAHAWLAAYRRDYPKEPT